MALRAALYPSAASSSSNVRAARIAALTRSSHASCEGCASVTVRLVPLLRKVSSSHWIALSPDPNALTPLSHTGLWRPLAPDQKSALWTDDYSNLLGAINIK